MLNAKTKIIITLTVLTFPGISYSEEPQTSIDFEGATWIWEGAQGEHAANNVILGQPEIQRRPRTERLLRCTFLRRKHERRRRNCLHLRILSIPQTKPVDANGHARMAQSRRPRWKRIHRLMDSRCGTGSLARGRNFRSVYIHPTKSQ